MGVLSKIKTYFDNKRLERLERDLKVINSREIKYNPSHFRNMDYIDPEKDFTLSVQENLTWFIGKPRLIRLFYTTFPELTQELNYFWAKAPTKYRKIHSGVPKVLARKMATILLGGGFTNDVSIYKVNEDGTISGQIDEDKSKKGTDTLEVLKDKIEFISKLKGGVTTAGWCGHLFAKYSVDTDLSEYPILEIADVRNAEIIKERGITTTIVFKNYYERNNHKYVHREYHMLNEKDEPMIVNKLFKIEISGEKEVPLATLPETKELLPTFTFEGLTGMIAFEMPNKLPNNDFLDTPYGASDYAGAHSSFDALDETLSEIYSEIRNNKTIRYIPDVFLKYTQDGEIAKLDEFITNYVKITGSIAEDANNQINITHVEDKQDSLDKKWKVAITTVCNNVGINPIAIGVTGLESITASETSQQERNKVTLETRSDKLESLKPFVENMLLQLLALNAWMQKKYSLEQKGVDRIDIDFSNCNVSVTFGDYIVQTKKDLIDTWGDAKLKGVASLDTSVREIWSKDWDEAQIQEEINRIKFEQGMALDNPMNLPGLTGLETDDEDDQDEIEQLEEEGKKDESNPEDAR